MNATVRGTIRRSVVHMGLRRAGDVRLAGIEAATAINHRPGTSGVSPALLLFGQRAKLFGEMYADGVPAARRPDAYDPSTALARRFRIRLVCKQVLERHHVRDLLRRFVSARTRPVKEVGIGRCVDFYRQYSYTGRYQEAVGKRLFSWSSHSDQLAEQ